MLKKCAAQLARSMKRSERLRIGLRMLVQLDDVTVYDDPDPTGMARR